MFVLGIDPGLSRCGYAVLEAVGPARRSAEAVSVGVITTPPGLPAPQRLAVQQRELTALFAEFSPQVLAIERVFVKVNARTAVGVAQVAGLAMAAAANRGAAVVEYTPTAVKRAIAGWGGADKDQMTRMVQTLLGLDEPPRPADAADAVAVALCHIAQSEFMRREQQSGASRATPMPLASIR